MSELILVSKKEAAKALSISIRTLEYLIGGGKIRYRRIGRRILIPVRALSEFARRDVIDLRKPNRGAEKNDADV